MAGLLRQSYEPSPDKPAVLLIEGKNPLYFIDRVFRPQRTALLDFGSISALQDQLRAIMAARDFFTHVKRVGIVRDAEESSQAAAQSIRGALKAAHLPVPAHSGELYAATNGGIATAFLILPDARDSGCFEHAVLDAFPGDRERDCVNALIHCVPKPELAHPGAMDNWEAKAKVHALIATSKKPEMTLGESGQAGLWNASHPSLLVIKTFLDNLVAGL